MYRNGKFKKENLEENQEAPRFTLKTCLTKVYMVHKSKY